MEEVCLFTESEVRLIARQLVLELQEGRFINDEEVDKRLGVLIEERKPKY